MIIKKRNPSWFKKGTIPWNKGIKGLIISSKKGKTLEELYGKERATKIKKLNSEKHKGKQFNKGKHWKIKDTSKMKGRNPWNKGMIGFFSGEKHYNWQGGKSFEVYPKEWKKVRKIIKEKYKNQCQECFIFENNAKHKHCVHHIDYNKKNCNINNLILLCRACHTKTNFNRSNWTKYFKEKIW